MVARRVKVAVEGCGHGTLHSIYASIKKACIAKQWDGVDLLIIGGDFQAVRNATDLNCMSVPAKFRQIGDFHEYYSGRRKAPYLTIFIGGNHEASSYLRELYYGGWVAPNIYYMGAANVIRINNLRIAGFSGIWKGYNYKRPHTERLPYADDEVRSAYHVREIDIRKLLLLKTQCDVGISHDWPRGIEWLGDHKRLFKKKDLFEKDSKAGILGSEAARQVLERLRPRQWFSAHLHCKFTAIMSHLPTPPGTDRYATRSEDRQQSTTHASKVALESLSAELASTFDVKSEQVVVENPDAIDLDSEDEIAEEEHIPDSKKNAATGQPGQSSVQAKNVDLAKVSLSKPVHSRVSDDLRALLPASFQKIDRPSLQETKIAPLPPPAEIWNETTYFLALDKCLPHRDFLSLLELEPSSPTADRSDAAKSALDKDTFESSEVQDNTITLTYDAEWLSILRTFSEYNPSITNPENLGEQAYDTRLAVERKWVEDNLVKNDRLTIPHNFQITAPAYEGENIREIGHEQPEEYTNKQTQDFCDLLEIKNFFDSSSAERAEFRQKKLLEIERSRAQPGEGFSQHRGFRGKQRGRGSHHRGRGRGKDRY